jgi:hypothetical protein
MRRRVGIRGFAGRALRPAVHVDRDQAMRIGQARGRDRQRRQQAAVHEFAAVHRVRGE